MNSTYLSFGALSTRILPVTYCTDMGQPLERERKFLVMLKQEIASCLLPFRINAFFNIPKLTSGVLNFIVVPK